MKKDKLLNLFNEFDFKMFIKKNMTSYKIRNAILEKVSESNCPSTTAITNYINKEFNLQWDTKTHSWNAYKSNTNKPSKNIQKVLPQDNNTLSINHENKLCDESPISKSSKITPNQLSLSFPHTKANTDISNHMHDNNDNLNCANSITNTILDKDISRTNIKNIPFNLSQCYEYIAASENMKVSLSINCVLFELIEKLICKKYTLKRKSNRSKVIHLALIECLKNLQ